jgi:hypothetical protein
MADVFTLTVPLDARFRALVGEVAGRYLELAGGTVDEGRLLAAEVAAAIDRLDADQSSSVAVVVQTDASGLSITLQANGQSATVTHPVPAKKP